MPFPPNVAFPPPPPGFAPPPPPAPTINNTQSNSGVVPPSGVTEMAGQILQALQAGTISQEQGLQVLNMLAAAQNGGLPVPPAQPTATLQAPHVQNGAQTDRFEQNGSRFRDRSRSPEYNRRRQSPRRSPPARRDSPTYGVYDPNAGPDGNAMNHQDRGDRGRGRGRNRGGRNDHNEYRQRTPPPPRRGSGGDDSKAYQNGSPKFIDWDRTLPRDNIKVFSRTLFIGGATGTEPEIRSIFSQFGKVQSCIVNQDKRHAFVKMLTRPDALAAKAGMDSIQDPNALAKARQVSYIDCLDTSIPAALSTYLASMGDDFRELH
jgi:protein NRD1